MLPNVSSDRLATLGCLVGAGAVGMPISVFLLAFLLLLPSDATLWAKVIGPFAGGIATFLFGFWYYIPLSVLIGGCAHIFLKSVGLRQRRAYLWAGPVVGLSVAMVTHFLMRGAIDELMIGGWPTNAYLASWSVGGTILMAIFWTIRRPDRPWDDLADRRKAGEDV
jgi:hypothetical protein